jgi:hypothetical protein
MSLVKTLAWVVIIVAIIVALYLSRHSWQASAACVALPLMVGGALGGLAQSLINTNGGFVIPRYDSAAKPPALNFGTLSDAFIGVVAAIAALLLGATLLNPEMLSGKTTKPSPTTTAAADAPGNEAPPATTVATDKSTALPTIPAWLRILSFGALAGVGAKVLLQDLAKRFAALLGSAPVKEAINEHVKDAVAKTTQSQKENLGSAVEVNRLEAIRPPLPADRFQALKAADPQQPIDRLRQDVERYAQVVNNPDLSARNAGRYELANEMLSVIRANDITTTNIAAQIPNQHNEGWALALATLIAAAPAGGDGTRLIAAAAHVQHKYVQYRICLAFFSLKSVGLLTAEELPGAKALLVPWTQSADESLRKKAQATLDYLSG